MKETEERLRACVAPLLSWYRGARRELPWRAEPTPYRVWVSEIMLQQTRIEAVIPYYERFMAELPDVAALAAVPEERLLKLWEGLGYYSRARNLKKAAERVTAERRQTPWPERSKVSASVMKPREPWSGVSGRFPRGILWSSFTMLRSLILMIPSTPRPGSWESPSL